MKHLPDPDLLTLPPAAAASFARCMPRWAERFRALHDPEGRPLGSGGGTFHALHEAWRASGFHGSLESWVDQRLRTLIHSGGQSRRLPAYAAAGKALMPLPALRGGIAQRLDQTLLDLQLDLLDELVEKAGPSARLLLACGDALLRLAEPLPALPDADVVLVGTWVPPETASAFGVLVCDAQDPHRLIRFLQKPASSDLESLGPGEVYFVDTGLWLLSAKAIAVLAERCGWSAHDGRFRTGSCASYELYARWGLHLGLNPGVPDADVRQLTQAVLPLPKASFLHFGTSRDVIESVYSLQQGSHDPLRPGQPTVSAHPRLFTQNALFEGERLTGSTARIWIENSAVPSTWTLGGSHVITGVPENAWTVALRDGACVDVTPYSADQRVLRVYGMEDHFRGPIGDSATRWLGAPVTQWFAARGIDRDYAGTAETDLQDAKLFPVVPDAGMDGRWIEWMTAEPTDPVVHDASMRTRWIESERCSASDLLRTVDLLSLSRQRDAFRARILPRLAAHHQRSIFHRLDLGALAAEWVRQGLPPPPAESDRDTLTPLHAARASMFRAAQARLLGQDPIPDESRAFAQLRDAVLARLENRRAVPRIEPSMDQIVWARAPVRLDLAGGWTDTPPYCIEQGGSVVNLAVDLNGQPPIQVFLRRTREPRIQFRSIDLGIGETIEHFAQLEEHNKRGSGFSIARAALSIAGFHPRFAGSPYPTLRAQLEALGGGFDITLLSAVPKGSGLGASSILCATLLTGLSDFAALGWDRMEVLQRTLAVEQLLGSGGGWQDQAGALWPGVKSIGTRPGWEQRPDVRYLPGELFEDASTRSRLLLYYTGIARVAHDILGEIVRGLFLNETARIRCLNKIGAHASVMADAIQRRDLEALAHAVQRSWILNQTLDAGTNPAAVQALFDVAGPDLQGAKLLGAGGGGFLFIIARSAEAALRIQGRLDAMSGPTGARRVDFSLSRTGLVVTRS